MKTLSVIFVTFVILLIFYQCEKGNYPNMPVIKLSPTIPNIIYPKNGQLDVPLNVKIKWSPALGAESYQLQLSNNPIFEIPIIDQSGIYKASYFLNKLSNNFEYFFRIRANNISGQSNWSEIIKFKTIDTTVHIITFKKTLGGSEDDIAHSVLQLEDGGYVIAGETVSFSSRELWIIKTDPNGNVVWDKRYYWNLGQSYSIDKTSDGGLILAGGLFLRKLNSTGNEEWIKDGFLSICSCVQNTQDGGFILAGLSDIIKIDSKGDYIWSNSFATNNINILSVSQTNDDCYVLAGEINFDALSMKTDEYGNQIWLQTFSFYGRDWSNSVEETNDGGFILSINSGYDEFSSFASLIKTDSFGEKIWSKSFSLGQGSGGQDYGYYISSVKIPYEGGYIAIGNTKGASGDNVDLWMVRLDEQSDVIWEKIYGIDHSNEQGNDIAQTYDRGYIVTGATSSTVSDKYDIWLIKTNKNGNVFD